MKTWRANILLDGELRPRVADLGLAGAVDPQLFVPASRGDGELQANSPRIGVFIPPLRDREDQAHPLLWAVP